MLTMLWCSIHTHSIEHWNNYKCICQFKCLPFLYGRKFQIVFLLRKDNQHIATFLLFFLGTVLWIFVTSYKYIFFLFCLFLTHLKLAFILKVLKYFLIFSSNISYDFFLLSFVLSSIFGHVYLDFVC